MAWNVADLPFNALLSRIRSHYGNEHFPPGVQPRREFAVSEDGTYDLLPASGIMGVVRQGTLVWYTGAVGPGDYIMPEQHRLFEHDPAIAGGADEEDANAVQADEHRADDPGALAPLENLQVWLGEVREIISMPAVDANGQPGRRTYFAMRGFVTAGYLMHVEPARWPRVASLVQHMHAREHVKTDLWEFCRGHDLAGIAQPVALDHHFSDPPPPLQNTLMARAFVTPGVLHYLDHERAALQRRPLTYRTPPLYVPIGCEAQDCPDRNYNRRGDEMGRCSWCQSWFHLGCLEEVGSVEEDWVSGRVQWLGGEIHGPVTRRVRNEGEPEFTVAARGLWLRSDPPTRTWGRVPNAIITATKELAYGEEEIGASDGSAFRAACRRAIQDGGAYGGDLTLEEADEAAATFEQDGWPEDMGEWIVYQCQMCERDM